MTVEMFLQHHTFYGTYLSNTWHMSGVLSGLLIFLPFSFSLFSVFFHFVVISVL